MCERGFYITITAFSASVLTGALWFQFGLHLHPCELCLYQRWPWVFALMISLVALLVPKKHPLLPWLIMGIFLVSTGLGILHVGVEQGWWRWGGCTAVLDTSSVDALRQALTDAAIVRCDQVAWQLFGISMAGYNALLSLSLALYSGYTGIKLWPYRKKR